MREPVKIGFLGPVREASSYHALSINQALTVAQGALPAFGDGTASLLAEDDGASAAGGRHAACALMERGVDIVAGLFSSSSAAAAVSVLAERRVPLVVAGANADDIAAAAGVFRICDRASDYADWIGSILSRLPSCAIEIVCEPSPFGQAIARRLCRRKRALADCPRKVILCAGQFRFVEQALRNGSARPRRGDILVLTDDCQASAKARAMAERLSGVEILVAGFTDLPAIGKTWARDRAIERWGTVPGAFFHETVASIETALHIAAFGAPVGAVSTVLGNLSFDKDGEARPHRMTLYRYRAGRLVEWPPDRLAQI